MIITDDQSLLDLEFDELREMLRTFCQQPTAQRRAEALRPLRDFKILKNDLLLLNEYAGVRNLLPTLHFEELEPDLNLLQMRDSVLNEDGFYRIDLAARMIITMHESLQGIELASNLKEFIEAVAPEPAIREMLNAVFDAKWQVKDHASPELAGIRDNILQVRRQISKNFSKAMKECASRGFLADTGEAFLHNRRVLAIFTTHKRKVAGVVMGSSNTGALTYIEPEVNVALNFELESLQDDERREIRRILKKLSDRMRQYAPLLRSYQKFLVELDFLQARARLAAEMEATLPDLSDETVIDLINAFHPLLKMKNMAAGKITIPQHISLERSRRMLVISGPNAGGKSITLKTVGLLQLMLQCGLLVPVSPGSKMCFFSLVLSDIGDHQSIENQLSTYSYRLKRMKFFLEQCHKRTLILLDEFGTGSDPDLGGALAEVFFTELYAKKSFGVITTHYGNIKLCAARLPQAVNGCMLFNTQSLEPTYTLSTGQPGSSFTFEVATINGIPESLIERARKLLSAQKVEMDRMLSSLQEERSRLAEETQNAVSAGEVAGAAIEEYEAMRSRLEEKLERQQITIERNNKFLHHGRKMAEFIDAYRLAGKNKELLDAIKKYVAMEKTKKEDEKRSQAIVKKAKEQTEKRKQLKRNREAVKVGATVRLENTKQVGTVMDIDKGIATVAIGNFKTKVDVNRLIALP